MAWTMRNMLKRAAEVLSASGPHNAMRTAKRLSGPYPVCPKNVLSSGRNETGMQEMSRTGDNDGKNGHDNGGSDKPQEKNPVHEIAKTRENQGSYGNGNGCGKENDPSIERNVPIEDKMPEIDSQYFEIIAKRKIVYFARSGATGHNSFPRTDTINKIKQIQSCMESRAISKKGKCPGCGELSLSVERIGPMFQYICKCGVAGPRQDEASKAIRKFYQMIVNYKS